ncbi:MAG: transglycosylase domain-containing protein [Acidimicrobiales bacterium]
MHVLKRLLRLPVIVGIVLVCAGLFAGAGFAIAPHAESALTAVDFERIEVSFDLQPGAQRTEVYDSLGNQMAILRFDIDRELVPLTEVPDDVVATILGVEDDKFWVHNGVDLRATARAMISNVSAGGINQGGSTITQQIVKLRVVGNERSFDRKILEAVLAARLEEQFTKDEILEFYLNEVYFGNGAYGLQAAAETYFGKNAGQLDVGDAALLAGLIRSPSVFDGFDDIDLARRRRSQSLERAEDLGIISSTIRNAYEQRALPSENLSPQRTNENLRRDYFIDEVTEELLGHLSLGETYDDRFTQVYSGGLRVWTTFDPEMQAQMQAARLEIFPEGTGDFEISMATVDPSTGAIKAFIGGPEFAEFQFNLATQAMRQPGSSFKTYVLAAAIESAELYPFDTISGQGPCTFPNPPAPDYVVNNFGGGKGSVGTVRQMTQRSSNCAFVRLGIKTGLDNVADIAGRMIGRDVDNGFQSFPSMSLGAQEVTPLEQAIGYSVLANGGIRMEPYYISRIEDREGNVLYEHVPRGRRVLSEETAAFVTDTLAANVQAGTGTRARLESGQPAAGKTGTAQDFSDAWFVGFTPQLSTAVWMGHPEERVAMRDIQGRSGTGGWVPARLWNAFMSRTLADTPIAEFADRPPMPRRSQFIFLDSDKCIVEIELYPDQPPLEFELTCNLVDVDDDEGEFTPRDDALCDIMVPGEDGLLRRERVRCNDVRDRLTTTTTTTSTTIPETSVPGADPVGTSPSTAAPTAPPTIAPTTTAP